MPPFYVTTQGTKLRLRKRRLVVEKQASGPRMGEETLASPRETVPGSSEIIANVPLVHVDQVILFGNVGLTTPVIGELMRRNIPVVFLSVGGRYKGRLVGTETGFGGLRLCQYNLAQDPAIALNLARAIVYGKLRNQRALLLRYGRRKADSVLSESAERIGALADQARRCQTLNSLNGCEGKAGAIYFGTFKRLLRHEWPFRKRVRRPPTDPVNVLLSFGYTLLLHNVQGAVSTVGLDPYVGFLHQIAYNRPSLALDMMEEFRPLVVDSVVMRCLNNEIVRADHFYPGDDADRPVVLDDEGRAKFISTFEARLADEFKHPDTNERVTYRRCIELQVRRLARALRGQKVYQPFIVR
jgi:CRISPR-associated protein Cas1